MAQVNVIISGKTYRMACEDGQEQHLSGLADRLNAAIDNLRGDFGEIGDQRLTVMAALTMADQGAEALKRVSALESEVAILTEERDLYASQTQQHETVTAAAVAAAAEQIEKVLGRLTGPATRG